MTGNSDAPVQSPEEILRKVDVEDDETTQDTWKRFYRIAYDEYTRFFARSISEWKGNPPGMALDFWLAGEKVFTAWYTALHKTPWWASTPSNRLREMRDFIPIEPYLDFVSKLAHQISEHADRQYKSAQKEIWSAAEQTPVAIMNAAVAATKSADEIRTTLMKAFEQFSPAIYLKYLREAAYFTSLEREKAGSKGEMLSDWLKAESQAQEKLRQGERIGY